MIKAILFDVGGVLGENNNLYATKIFASRYNIDPDELYEFLDSNELKYSTDCDTEGFFDMVVDKYDIPKDRLKEVLNLAPYHEKTMRVAEELTQEYDVYVLSNQTGFRGEFLRNDPRMSFFKKIFISDEIGYVKPDPKAFEYALDAINMKPEECLFVDDRDKNIVQAKEMGFKVIKYDDHEQFVEDLHKIIE